MTRRLAAAVALLLAVPLAACSGSGTSAGGHAATASSVAGALSRTAHGATRAATTAYAQSTTTPLCGSAASSTPPTTFQHVVWIWMENHGYDQIIGPRGSTPYTKAPYINGTIKAQCGLATNYHNISHPSLPNYLAAVAGTTGGVTTDCSPSSCPQSARTLFQQVLANGKTWRGYDESMPSACYLSNTTLYAPRHNPAVYYPAMRSACDSYDVPMGSLSSGRLHWALTSGKLPAFAFVTPNLCHDMHDCSITTGDNWLKAWIPLITSSASYRSGSTAVFVTWDEGEHGSTNNCALNTTDVGCHVATLVLSRWTKPGTRSSTLFNHYALLRTTENLLGITTHLGHAADSTSVSMRRAFHL